MRENGSAPDILHRRSLGQFYGIPFTRARHVDELTEREVTEALLVMNVEAEIMAPKESKK